MPLAPSSIAGFGVSPIPHVPNLDIPIELINFMIFPHDMSHPPKKKLKISQQNMARFSHPSKNWHLPIPKNWGISGFSHQSEHLNRSWEKRQRPWDWWPLRPCHGPVVSTTGARQPRCSELRRDKLRCRKSMVNICENCSESWKILEKNTEVWAISGRCCNCYILATCVSHIWICPTDGGRSHLYRHGTMKTMIECHMFHDFPKPSKISNMIWDFPGIW